MKTIVVYTSKTGLTKRYAEWIAEELGCEAVSMKSVNDKMLTEYDCLIYGGWLMAGKISGLDKFKAMKSTAGKQLVVFATGAAAMEMTDVIEQVPPKNFTEEELERIPFFYFEGGLDYDNMGFVGRNMIKMMRKAMKKNPEMAGENAWIMERIEHSFDNCSRDYIKPLVEKARAL